MDCPGRCPPLPRACRATLRLAFLLTYLLAPFASRGSGEGGLAAMATSRLQQHAQQAVERQQFAEAVPALEELERRLRESEEPSAIQAREMILYLLGLGRLQASEFGTAAETLALFITTYPHSRQAPLARLFEADAWFFQSNFSEARPRYAQLADDAIAFGRLDGAQQLALWDRFSDCCFAAADWAEGPRVFRALQVAAQGQLDPTLASEKQAKAASYLLQAALAREELGVALEALPGLLASGGPVRHDLSLNLALVKGGDTLYDLGRYGEALHFYQQVLRPPQLEAYWKEEVQTEEAREARRRGLQLNRSEEASEPLVLARQRLEAVRAAFVDPAHDYSTALAFRIARCYLARGRTFEAYWAFSELGERAQAAADATYLEEARYGQVKAAAANAQLERLRGAAQAYLADHAQVRFLADVAQEWVNAERQAEQREALGALLRSLAARVQESPALRDAPQLIYLIGATLVEVERVELIPQLLEPLLVPLEGQRGTDGVRYWLGLSSLFRGEFAAARAEFETVVRKYTNGPYTEDASFRIGVCYFGELEYRTAEAVLAGFVRDHPESRLLSEAQALLGDLAAAEGRVDDALAAYRRAEEAGAQLDPPHLGYINHAVFQAGRLLAANQRWNEMASWFETYIGRWGNGGRLSDALYEQGRALEALGRIDELLASWFRAILRFGNDPADEGADLLLRDYAKKHRRSTGDWPLEQLRFALAEAEATGQIALMLRLAYALRTLAPEATDLPRVRADQFSFASPAVLVAVARHEQHHQPELALAALEQALGGRLDTPFAEEALHLLGAIKAEAGDRTGALGAYRRAADLFPNSRRTARARLREGDLLQELGQWEAALVVYRNVLQTREWRGEAWAEANYKTGCAHLAAGALEPAFGFFQRVYVLYGGMVEWAAPAYLRSGRVLEQLGRPAEAAATYREMLEREDLRSTDAGREARQQLARLP